MVDIFSIGLYGRLTRAGLISNIYIYIYKHFRMDIAKINVYQLMPRVNEQWVNSSKPRVSYQIWKIAHAPEMSVSFPSRRRRREPQVSLSEEKRLSMQ